MANKPILQDSITGVWSFILSIDWEDPWLYILVSFHIWCALATLCVILYRRYYGQIALFLFYLGLAFASEYINTWAAANYKLFSEQQYFDSPGLFISLVFSLPLLCNALVIVFYWMWDVTCTMINLKRVKVKQSLKARELVAQKEDASKSEDEPKETDKTDKTEETDLDKHKQSDSLDGEKEQSDSLDGEKVEVSEDEKSPAEKKED